MGSGGKLGNLGKLGKLGRLGNPGTLRCIKSSGGYRDVGDFAQPREDSFTLSYYGVPPLWLFKKPG